jgi:hypothetical protein
MGRIPKLRLETKIDAFCTPRHEGLGWSGTCRAGLCRDTVFDALLFAAEQTLFQSLRSSDHCLHSFLPAIRTRRYVLGDRGHELVLLHYRTILYNKFLLMRHLFNTVNSSVIFLIFAFYTSFFIVFIFLFKISTTYCLVFALEVIS